MVVWLLIGLVVGANVGLLTCALMVAAARGDRVTVVPEWDWPERKASR